MVDENNDHKSADDIGGQNQRVVMCSVCAGTGKPVSGGDCICGGKGTYSAELHGLRNKVNELEVMVDRAHDALHELLNQHINIATPAAQIAKRGIWGDAT